MKRSLSALGFFFFAAFSAGCPVYSDNVVSVECIYATDCGIGFSCVSGVCIAPPPIADPHRDGGVADAEGDASRKDATSDGASSDALSPDAATDAPVSGDAGPVVFCGNPNDCAADETCSTDGTCHRGNCSTIPCINQYQCAITANGPACVRGDSKGCSADRQCFTNERCIDGTCTSVGELCTDRAQCGVGKVCADGRCTTSCTVDGQCASGFLCRTALGICTAKAETCVHTNDCGSKDEVCVDGACVPRCGVIGACGNSAGVCVDNGCVPSAKLVSECGGQGSPASCTAGNVCLQHHCYLACGQDAGSCNAQSSAPICKSVTVSSMIDSLCGTTETLGSDCDPTVSKLCADGKTCIDGYCK